jgi:hypothetical protein
MTATGSTLHQGPERMTQTATIDGHGNLVVQIEGDGNTIVPNLPWLRLTRYHQRRTIKRVDGREPEADLVSAYTLSIPMIGREAITAELWAWMTNGEPISVRVLIGSAGRGKTRLALDLEP